MHQPVYSPEPEPLYAKGQPLLFRCYNEMVTPVEPPKYNGVQFIYRCMGLRRQQPWNYLEIGEAALTPVRFERYGPPLVEVNAEQRRTK